MIPLIALAAVTATIIGGLFALKYRDRLHLILGFSAGALIGVAFFDLLPEALELGSATYEVSFITRTIAIGFAVFMILDRFVLIHTHHSDEHPHSSQNRGRFGALSLALHSFLDGLAIGFAFQVNTAVGVIVTTAVLVHDFSDGINTVSLILKNNGSHKEAFRWLIIDALAPAIGILAASAFHMTESLLALVLATFCGFFLYIGASDLLPESHHSHPTFYTTLATLLGMAVLYTAVHYAGV